MQANGTASVCCRLLFAIMNRQVAGNYAVCGSFTTRRGAVHAPSDPKANGRCDAQTSVLPQPSASRQRAGRTSCNRPAARRVGKECVSTCRSRWSPFHYNKEINEKQLSTNKEPSLNIHNKVT